MPVVAVSDRKGGRRNTTPAGPHVDAREPAA